MYLGWRAGMIVLLSDIVASCGEQSVHFYSEHIKIGTGGWFCLPPHHSWDIWVLQSV